MADAGRWLDREALARHVSVRVDYVPRLVRQGKLPAPSLHLGPKQPRWDREAVDAAFGGGLASRAGGIEASAQAAINEILQGR